MENFTLFDWYLISIPVYFVLSLVIARTFQDIRISDLLCMVLISVIPGIRDLILIAAVADSLKLDNRVIFKQKE